MPPGRPAASWRWPWPGRAARVRSPLFEGRSARTYPMAAGVVTATVNSAVSRTGIDGRAAGRQKSVPCLQHPGPAGLHRRREEITTWPTGASEGPGGGRVRVRRDRYGTRRCGAAAPVVSAHARACELRHSLTAPNEPCVEVRTRSSAPTPDAVTHLWGHLNPGSFRGACRTREPPGALPAFHACTFHACRSGRRA